MSHKHWNWSSQQSIASDTTATTGVIEPLLDRLNEAQWPPGDVFGVHLAIEEALVNAIKHGNGDDVSKQVSISYRVSEQCVQIEIADEGRGFDPNSLPDPTTAEHVDQPHGRGVMLMRSFMTRVEFNELGNCVLLEKCRS
ncbi:MAG TPA: ATP-binding protein [Pirellulaceae bacterium]|nr:ATP-binding protein [Pirellulaceae bacterium]